MSNKGVNVETIPTTRANVLKVLAELAPRIDGTPVYRALSHKSFAAYRSHGMLVPTNGDALLVGDGVFFYFDPVTVSYLCLTEPCAVVASFERLSRGRKTIDTRVKGYDLEALEILDREKGSGNYNGFDLWLKVLENDTITASLVGSPRHPDGLPIYTRRNSISAEELDFEVLVTDVPAAVPRF